MTQKKEFHVRSERIEQLAAKLEQSANAELHATAMELLQCVMELHGTGLDRIMQVLSESDEAGSLTRQLLDDNLVSSLLLLHNLHPEDLATRVRTAVDKLGPQLESHSCAAEIMEIDNGVVSVRLMHHGGGCHSTAATMAATLEDTITEAAPDAERISIETLEAPMQAQLVSIAQIPAEGVGHATHQAR
jgi:Fe-S cluster biogenesis protein NfuA